MLQKIISLLEDTIRAEEWVDKYGGLVRPVSRKIWIPVDEEKGYEVTQTFPISCGITANECWEHGRFKDFIPDSRKKSVVYFEEKTPLTFGKEKTYDIKGLTSWTANVRFVAWLNLPLLGYTDCSISSLIVASLQNTLNIKFDRKNDILAQHEWLHSVDFNIESQEPKNNRVFANYSYENIDAILFNPFDHFVLNISVKAVVANNCMPKFVVKAPLKCGVEINPAWEHGETSDKYTTDNRIDTNNETWRLGDKY